MSLSTVIRPSGLDRIGRDAHLNSQGSSRRSPEYGGQYQNMMRRASATLPPHSLPPRIHRRRCVEIIAKEGRSLKELYLVSCKITDHALIAIGQYSSTIETVDAGWCKDITDQGATQIAQSSKSLRYLGLMRCDKVRIPPLAVCMGTCAQ
ncbi:unnamed protein product [Boreogadus saida]